MSYFAAATASEYADFKVLLSDLGLRDRDIVFFRGNGPLHEEGVAVVSNGIADVAFHVPVVGQGPNDSAPFVVAWPTSWDADFPRAVETQIPNLGIRSAGNF
jgi:hypothetical protein